MSQPDTEKEQFRIDACIRIAPTRPIAPTPVQLIQFLVLPTQ